MATGTSIQVLLKGYRCRVCCRFLLLLLLLLLFLLLPHLLFPFPPLCFTNLSAKEKKRRGDSQAYRGVLGKGQPQGTTTAKGFRTMLQTCALPTWQWSVESHTCGLRGGRFALTAFTSSPLFCIGAPRRATEHTKQGVSGPVPEWRGVWRSRGRPGDGSGAGVGAQRRN